jgi:mRNA interferase MazF
VSPGSPPVRGQVFWVDLGFGRKPWLVVSNNQRNRALDTVIAARITTTRKHANIPTIVALAAEDPLDGYVLCDDLFPIRHVRLGEPAGALGVATMREVSAALRIALP